MPMVMMMLMVVSVLVLLVLVLCNVCSDRANNCSCDRSEHATANFMCEESTASATNQCCAQSTLTILTWSTKARTLRLPGRASGAVVAVVRLRRTVGRLRTVCGLLTVWGLLIGDRAGIAIVWLWGIGIWSTIWLLRGCAVALLGRSSSVVWLRWVARMISLMSVVWLRGVILLLLRGAIWGLLLPTAVVVSAGHGARLQRWMDGSQRGRRRVNERRG